MDPQTIITLDVILSLVPAAKEFARRDIANGDYPNPTPANADFFSIERNGQHLVFWLDGDNNAHRIARCRDAGRAAFIIWHMTQLVIARVTGTATEPSAAAPVADEIETPSIPSGSQFKKQILFDRKTGDFAMYFEGELVGYAPSYLEANSRLNTLAYEVLRRRAA